MATLVQKPFVPSHTESCSTPHERFRRSPFHPDDEPTPSEPPVEPDEPSEPDDIDVPCTDDGCWDVFIPDDDQYEPSPEPGDFWNDKERNDGSPNDE